MELGSQLKFGLGFSNIPCPKPHQLLHCEKGNRECRTMYFEEWWGHRGKNRSIEFNSHCPLWLKIQGCVCGIFEGGYLYEVVGCYECYPYQLRPILTVPRCCLCIWEFWVRFDPWGLGWKTRSTHQLVWVLVPVQFKYHLTLLPYPVQWSTLSIFRLHNGDPWLIFCHNYNKYSGLFVLAFELVTNVESKSWKLRGQCFGCFE